jgi:hypothetical protein
VEASDSSPQALRSTGSTQGSPEAKHCLPTSQHRRVLLFLIRAEFASEGAGRLTGQCEEHTRTEEEEEEEEEDGREIIYSESKMNWANQQELADD